MTDPSVMQNADYVIIGGGSAGCVLAARLSEDENVKVVLIEAGGPDNSPVIHLPVGYAKTLGDPKFDWRYAAGPEPGYGGRIIPYARGRVLGGSGSINALVWSRGGRFDYDQWKNEYGCVGWGWDDVLPYFMRAEDFAGGGTGRGRGGPAPINFNPGFHPPSRKLIAASLEAGLPETPDHNSEAPLGLSRTQLNWRDGKRMSTAAAYLKPARSRKNLVVLTDTMVERLCIENGVVMGAVVAGKNHTGIVHASREVILSAGAIGTPLILERSGFGDPARLAARGVDAMAHAPEVGENLRDHALVSLKFRLKGLNSINVESRGLKAVLHGIRYALFKDGLLSGTPTEVLGYARVSNGEGPADIQIFGAPLTYSIKEVGGSKKIVIDSTPGMGLSFCQCRPVSTGSVHLGDRAGGADLKLNFLTEEEDQRVALSGVKFCRSLMTQPSIAPFIAKEEAPAGEKESDEELTAFIKASAATGFHAAGSCRMGPDEDSVVDLSLRARAVRGLRIVDASVMPALVGANTHAPTVMIAEKAADLIRTAN